MVVARRDRPQYRRLLSAEEYLEREVDSAEKHEYYQGEIFLLAGGSVNHNRITANTLAHLHASLRSRPCQVFGSDMRLYVEAHGLYTYPDVSVVCGEVVFHRSRDDTITNPVLVVEVLSPSTRDYDRGQKFEFYRALPALRDYLVVHQDRPHVEYYHRDASGDWMLTECKDLAKSVKLQGAVVDLPLEEVYWRVEWSSKGSSVSA